MPRQASVVVRGTLRATVSVQGGYSCGAAGRLRRGWIDDESTEGNVLLWVGSDCGSCCTESGMERFFHDERYRPRFDRGGFEGIDVCGFLSELDIVNRATVLCTVETELSWAWCEEDRPAHELAE